MKKRKIILIYLLETVLAGVEDKPRIQSNDGNLIFSTGDQRSITFKPGQSASVYLDEEDLVQVISDYRRTETEVAQIKTNLNGNNCNSSPCANEVSLCSGCGKISFFSRLDALICTRTSTANANLVSQVVHAQ